MTPDQAQAMIDAINRLAAVAELIFNIPPTEQLSALFSAGFVLPCACYMVAHGVGAIVNMWRT